MRRTLLPVFFLLLIQNICAQTDLVADTAIIRILAERDDKARQDMIIKMFMSTWETNPGQGVRNSQHLLIGAQQNNDLISQSMALATLGANYRVMGNTIKGLEYLIKATVIGEKTGSPKLMTFVKRHIGLLYKDRGEYDKAINAFNQSYGNAIAAKDERGIGLCYLGLGETYLPMNKLDSALKYSLRAYELATGPILKIYFGNICSDLGEIHDKMGNSSLALGYFKAAIADAKNTGNPRPLNWAYTALAEHYRNAGQLDSGRYYAKQAIDAVQNTPYANMGIRSAKLLSELYENSNSDSTVKYMKMYMNANDSLFNVRSVQQAQLLSLEEQQRQQQVAFETERNHASRKQNIQLILIAIGIVMLISLYLLLSRSVITNPRLIQFFGIIALLIVFEFLNLLLHPFLERVTNHSPVWMLVTLVCIAALLVPLHHKLEKWATHKLVEKNKAIRLANARKTINELDAKG